MGAREMNWDIHLCDTCKLANNCPKSERFKQVKDICDRHLDEITDEIQTRPRDTDNKEYMIVVQCGVKVVECPYYEVASALLN